MFSDGEPKDPHHRPLEPTVKITARGWLVPIGGCLHSPEILTRFVDLCGGVEAHIVVIPSASNEPDHRSYYETVFAPFQQRSLEVLPVATRADAKNPALLAHIETATGVFFTGGNQLKLATMLGGTPMAELLRTRFATGMTVAGTSAGAAFLSDHMIAFGEEGKAPRTAMVTTVAGLGLTKRYIIDQHFRQRDRLGRLVTAIAYNPVMIGLGVDEDTAAFISPDEETIHVVGTGAVTVVDAADFDASVILEALPGTQLELTGMVVHVVNAGSVYVHATSPLSSAGQVVSSDHADAGPY